MSRTDAQEIWRAGVAAVNPEELIQNFVSLEPLDSSRVEGIGSYRFSFGGLELLLSPEANIFVVGMGKASGKMAKALEEVLAPLIYEDRVKGWVNVPDKCVERLQTVHLHGARRTSVNEPTEEGVFGSQVIRGLADDAKPEDLVICLVSGGGSALLPLPVPELTLNDKVAVTRFLSSSGANIKELNIVRKELSQLKGGGLREVCRGKRLISLVLSDVLGDPIDLIASGATVQSQSDVFDAIKILLKYQAERQPSLKKVCYYLKNKSEQVKKDRENTEESSQKEDEEAGYENHFYGIIGNNRTAVEAAADCARMFGYNPLIRAAHRCEGEAEGVGRDLYELGKKLFFDGPNPEGYDCIIEGGEPVVRLVPESERGSGGRNQQLVLAALICCLHDLHLHKENPLISKRIPILLSGGTDGEDGPTNSAGAWFDRKTVNIIYDLIEKENLNPMTYLKKNDAWNFFKRCQGLLFSGPTGTNVCDLRIMLKEQS